MFGRKKKQAAAESKLILGMVILQDENSIDPKAFSNDFKNNYNKSIDEINTEKEPFSFEIENEHVVIAHMPVPIPADDIEKTAKYTYNWETAVEDLKDQKSHLIVAITSGGLDQVKRFKIFTQVISAILRTTNAIGVYKGNQTLLISKEEYLDSASLMEEDFLPLNLWIYFGFKKTDKGNNGYTYGLKEFNKTEMEIIDSLNDFEEIEEFLFAMTDYVLESDVTFQDGETCGRSAEEKIGITLSTGCFLDGETLKLAF